MRYIYLAIICLVSIDSTFAHIYCPEDLTLNCYDDITDPGLCGHPILTGTDAWYEAKYIDEEFLTQCDEGYINRTWYIDYNDNDIIDEQDRFCSHIIYLVKIDVPTILEFPDDITVSCMDDIKVEPPSILTGPCEKVGYDIDVNVFDIVTDACAKVHHVYKVINWCIYDPNDPNSEGKWEHTRVIKVKNEGKPEFTACDEQIFDVGADCETEVTLTNSAMDTGDCPSDMLIWTAVVDLWGDGTDDLTYGPNETGIFFLAPAANGAEVSITLPEALGVSSHKVKWSVTDGCHNFASCFTTFEVQDNKPPTPYCLNFITAAFNGQQMPLTIPVSLFDRGSFDNCTPEEDIILSFSSNVEDQTQVIECGDEGFKFFRIYATDRYGNQDYCEVFAIIFDNSSCDGVSRPEGSITILDGSAVEYPMMTLMDGDVKLMESDVAIDGSFAFVDAPLTESLEVMPVTSTGQAELVDIEDLVLLQRHILGLETLSGYSKLAGDVDKDGQLKIADLQLIKDHILGKHSWAVNLRNVPSYMSADVMEYHEGISFADYNQGFDFVSFTAGNISDLLGEGKAEVAIFDIEQNGKVWTVTNKSKLITTGFHINLAPEQGELVDAEVLNLFPMGKTFVAGELSFTIKLKHDKELLDLDGILQLVDGDSNRKVVIHTGKPLNNPKYGEALNEIEIQLNENAYPNPSNGVFAIDGEITQVELTDVAGKRCAINTERQENGIFINVLNYNSGLHMLTYVKDDNPVAEKILLLK